MSTVLVVDDDAALVRALTINLRARGYQVLAAGTGAGALQLAATHPPDAVVLDLGLPDLDGSEVIAGLRGWTDVPILVLSAREQAREKVAALDAGADDYVVKPFGMDELLARNPGRVVDHATLLTEVWGPAFQQQTNYLRVYMATLRRKLEPDAAKPRHLLTESGRGYRFEP